MSEQLDSIDKERALRSAIRYFEREMLEADSVEIEETARLFMAELTD
jgi:hypothetical protein